MQVRANVLPAERVPGKRLRACRPLCLARACFVALVLGLAMAMSADAAFAVPLGNGRAEPAASAVPADSEFLRARAASTAILARREFQAAEGPSWLDVQVAHFWSWLGRLLSGVGRLGKLAPWLATAMEWTLFVAAGVGLLLYLRRTFARQRLRSALGAGAAALQVSAWGREAEDWQGMAAERAAAREWREAVHCLYWAAIVLLESRRAWRHNPSRTPREYVRLLKAGSARSDALRGLTGIFERTWYGLRPAEQADFEKAQVLFETLSARESAPGAEPGSQSRMRPAMEGGS